MHRRGRRRALSDDQERELLNTQAELTALSKHPSWPTLERVIDQKERRLHKRLLAQALHGLDGVSPRAQAYAAGYIDGMRYFLLVPENAEARLEQALKEYGITQEVTSGS